MDNPVEESVTSRKEAVSEETSDFYDDEGALDDLYTADSDTDPKSYNNSCCRKNSGSPPLKTNIIFPAYSDEYDTDKPERVSREYRAVGHDGESVAADNPTSEENNETDSDVYRTENADDQEVDSFEYNRGKTVDSSGINQSWGNDRVYAEEVDSAFVESRRPLDPERNRLNLNVANNDYSEFNNLTPDIGGGVEKSRTRRKNAESNETSGNKIREKVPFSLEEHSNKSCTRSETQNKNAIAQTNKNITAVAVAASEGKSSRRFAADGNGNGSTVNGTKSDRTENGIFSNPADLLIVAHEMLRKPKGSAAVAVRNEETSARTLPPATDRAEHCATGSAVSKAVAGEVKGAVGTAPPYTVAAYAAGDSAKKSDASDDCKIARRISDFVHDLLSRAAGTSGMKKELGLCKTYEKEYAPVGNVNVQDEIMKGVMECVGRIVSGTVKSQSCAEMPPELTEFLDWLLLDGVCAREEFKRFIAGGRKEGKAASLSQKGRRPSSVKFALVNGTSINSLYNTIKKTIAGGVSPYSRNRFYPFSGENANAPLPPVYGITDSKDSAAVYNGKRNSPLVYSERYDNAIGDDGGSETMRRYERGEAVGCPPSGSVDRLFPHYTDDRKSWYDRGVGLSRLDTDTSSNRRHDEAQVEDFNFQ